MTQDKTHLYTVSKDGALFVWHYVDGEGDTGKVSLLTLVDTRIVSDKQGRWVIKKKHYFKRRSKVNSVQYHPASQLLVVGFSKGYAFQKGDTT